MDDAETAVLVVAAMLAFMLDGDFLFKRGSLKKKRRRPRWWVKEWIRRRSREECNTMYKLQLELLQLNDHAEFRSMLRMDEATYELLLGLVRPLITKKDTTYRKAISAEERLTLTLNYLAHGGSNVKLSHQYRIGRSTIGKIIRETCEAIHKVLKGEYLITPTDPLSWWKMSQMFRLRWNFPHCIAAMDGKHFTIYPPDKTGSLFFNYKGSFSIVLLALVNANYEFSYISVGCEGRVPDGGIWRDCDFKLALDSGKVKIPPNDEIQGMNGEIPYFIVADDAFPLGPNLLKPYAKRELTEREQIFNYRLSRARRISENAFGILVNRFRVFLANIYRTPETVEAMILAATSLHNFLRRRLGSSYITLKDVDYELPDYTLVDGAWRKGGELENIDTDQSRNPTRFSKDLREKFADYFINPEGEVPWQYQRVQDGYKAKSKSK